ncbi:Glucosaminyl phosphatidylinositol (GlcN-PI) nositol acylation protein, partial [Tulasnella sp. 403]
KTVIELGAYVVVWWLLFGLARWMGGGRESVSRRLLHTDTDLTKANMPYVLLTAAYNTLFLLSFMILELAFTPQQTRTTTNTDSGRSTRPHRSPTLDDASFSFSEGGELAWESHRNSVANTPNSQEPSTLPSLPPPALFEAINLNGLPVFLVANVATGLINLSMQTMYASDLTALSVLVVYLIGVCGIAWAFRERRLIRL